MVKIIYNGETRILELEEIQGATVESEIRELFNIDRRTIFVLVDFRDGVVVTTEGIVHGSDDNTYGVRVTNRDPEPAPEPEPAPGPEEWVYRGSKKKKTTKKKKKKNSFYGYHLFRRTSQF